MVKLFTLGFVVDLVDHVSGPAKQIEASLAGVKAAATALNTTLATPPVLARWSPRADIAAGIAASAFVPQIPLAAIASIQARQLSDLSALNAKFAAAIDLLAVSGHEGLGAPAAQFGALRGARVVTDAEATALAHSYEVPEHLARGYLQSRYNDDLILHRRSQLLKTKALPAPPPTPWAAPPSTVMPSLAGPTIMTMENELPSPSFVPRMPPIVARAAPVIEVPPGGFGGGLPAVIPPTSMVGELPTIAPRTLPARLLPSDTRALTTDISRQWTRGGGWEEELGGAMPPGGGPRAPGPPTGPTPGQFGRYNPKWPAVYDPKQLAMDMLMTGATMTATGLIGKRAFTDMTEAVMQEQRALSFAASSMDDGALATVHLAEAQSKAEKLAEESGTSTLKLIDMYRVARSLQLDHAKSLDAVAAANKLVISTTHDVAEAERQSIPTTRLVTTLMHEFGGTGDYWSSKLTQLVTKRAFLSVGEVTSAMTYALPTIKEFHLNMDQSLATLAGLTAGGLIGQKAGTAFRPLIQMFGAGKKLYPFARTFKDGTLDIVASLEALHTRIQSLPPISQARFVTSLGFGIRNAAGAMVMLNKTREAYLNSLSSAKSAGEAERTYQSRIAQDPSRVFAGFQAAFFDLKAHLGALTMPWILSATRSLITLVQWMRTFADTHPWITSVALKFGLLATAALLVAGPLLIIGGAALMVKTTLGALTGLSFFGLGNSVFHLSSYLLFATKTVKALSFWLGMVRAFGISEVLTVIPGLGTALAWLAGILGVSVGWAAALVAALPLAAYAIYHWWDDIKAFFVETIPQWYDAGVEWMKQIAKGIYDASPWVVQKAIDVAAAVEKYLIGKSPPPEGPLRTLDRPGWMQALATGLDPSPVLRTLDNHARTVRRSLDAAAWFPTPVIGPMTVLPVRSAATVAPRPISLPIGMELVSGDGVAHYTYRGAPNVVLLGRVPGVPAIHDNEDSRYEDREIASDIDMRKTQLSTFGVMDSNRERAFDRYNVTIHYNPTTNIAPGGSVTADDVRRLHETHADELVDKVRRAMRREEQVRY